MNELTSPNLALQRSLTQLYQLDSDFLAIEVLAGALSVRQNPATFASLVRIIVGQQLSAKAADAIFIRLTQLLEISPNLIINCRDEDLKQVGLSRAKVASCKALAAAILEGRLDFQGFASLTDDEITSQLTQIKGIGCWTAEVFMLFCLERLDAFPASDLAIQVSYQTLKTLPDRPTRKQLIALCEPLRSHRGTAAHLLWHYYRYLQHR